MYCNVDHPQARLLLAVRERRLFFSQLPWRILVHSYWTGNLLDADLNKPMNKSSIV
jgi:hypothetical protein